MKKFLKIILIIAAFVTLDILLNFTWYNPAFIVPVYGKLQNLGIVNWYAKFKDLLHSQSSGLYPEATIANLTHGLVLEPRAETVGTVTDVVKSWDSDWHLNISDGQGHVLVAEISPEYPLKPPSLGQKIRIKGIVRYDGEHRWWELHPVFGWQAEK